MINNTFDSNDTLICTYCGEAIKPAQDKVIIGIPGYGASAPTSFYQVYHRDCDAINRAQRVQKYMERLREFEPMIRKESL